MNAFKSPRQEGKSYQVKSANEPGAHQIVLYPGLCSKCMKQLRVYLLPPGCNASLSYGVSPQEFICQYPLIYLGGKKQ